MEQLSDQKSAGVRSDILDVTYIDPWRIRDFGEDVLYLRFPNGMSHSADAASGVLTLVDRSLEPLQRVVRALDYVPRDASSLGQFAAMPLWDACGDSVVLWDPRTSSVRWIDRVGRDLRVVSTGLEPVTLSDEAIEGYLRYSARLELGPSFADFDINFRSEARRLKPLFSEPGTAVADLRCGFDGSAWLRLFDATNDPLGRGTDWVRIGPMADITAVRFPTGFQPMVIGREGVILGTYEISDQQVLTTWSVDPRRTR